MVVNHAGYDDDMMNVFDASGALAGIYHTADGHRAVDHVRANLGGGVGAAGGTGGALVATVERGTATDTWETTYRHDDHLGSAQAATDAGGLVTFQEYYTPFGEVENAHPANGGL